MGRFFSTLRSHPVWTGIGGALSLGLLLWQLVSSDPPLPALARLLSTEVGWGMALSTVLGSVGMILIGIVTWSAWWFQRLTAGYKAKMERAQGDMSLAISEKKAIGQELRTAQLSLERTSEALREERITSAKLMLEALRNTAAVGQWDPVFIVRFIEYNDAVFADHLEYLVRSHLEWPLSKVRDDGSTLRQGGARIMFECGKPELAKQLAAIFNHGMLLSEMVGAGKLANRDDYSVLVSVFPKR
jgi:hypothetical protein